MEEEGQREGKKASALMMGRAEHRDNEKKQRGE